MAPNMDIPKNYQDGIDLTEDQLDDAFEYIEGFLNSTKLDGDNIQAQGIPTAAIANSAVTEAKIAGSAVTTTKIADDAVTTAKILDANVTAAKLATDAVETAKIKNNAVSTAKIADGAVTQAKRAALGQQASSSSGSATVVGLNPAAQVTNLSVTITTTGRPVFVGLQSIGAGSDAYMRINKGSSASSTLYLYIYRDGSAITKASLWFDAAAVSSGFLMLPPGVIWHVDAPSAGTHTYAVYAESITNNTQTLNAMQLVAYEL